MSDPTGSSAGTIYVPGFKGNLSLSPQQSKSRLANHVDSDFAAPEGGQFFNEDDVGTVDPTPVNSRVPISPSGFIDVSRRFGSYKPFQSGVFFDDLDKLRQLSDPTSKGMQAMMAGQGRGRDAQIIAGMRGAYQIQNEDQSYTTGAVNANIIAANYAKAHSAEDITKVQNTTTNGYGLTIGKLIAVKMALDNGDMDESQPGDAATDLRIACTATQLGDLLQSIPVTNSLYGQATALVEGTTTKFMGFEFIRMSANKKSNLLPKTGYTRSVMAWHKRAVVYRGRSVKNLRTVERADFSFRPYAYYEFEHGAFRHYDEGVWEIQCDEATTGFN